MTSPHLPTGGTRREMRKALIRLRMEMHRQEIRHEARQALNPMARLRGMAKGVEGSLGIKHASLWGVGLVAVLGFFSGRGAKSGKGSGGFGRAIKLGTGLLPLLKLVLQGSHRR